MANTVSPARGMRDILPLDKAKREYVLNIIKETYKQFGFDEIETPAIELIERLKSNQGGDNESMLFEIMKRGLNPAEEIQVAKACDLGLRYDLTLPLSRFYATHQSQLPKVFRVLQTDSVWRAERPQKGRFRQFRQCDIDIVGEETVLAETELLIATLSAFKALGLSEKITLHINDRRILSQLLAAFEIDEEKSGAVLVTLDKWDKIGADGVAAELATKGYLSQEAAQELVNTVSTLREVTDITSMQELQVAGKTVELYDLPQITSTVKSVLPWAKINFNISLVRGMGYYTGPIFEVVHDDFSSSVAGGGRYDKMIGKWLGKDVPACGFSIGFERIIDFVDYKSNTENKVALLYAQADLAPMFAVRELLREAGFVPVFVKPPRKLNGNFFARLEAEGYSRFVDLRNIELSDVNSVDDLTFKVL